MPKQLDLSARIVLHDLSKVASWSSAEHACKTLGSNLVIIKSQNEQQALASKMSQRIWIGFHRDAKKKSRWLWFDETEITYTA